MGKNLDPKCKQCRRTGEKLFLKGERCYTAKCAIVKRNYAPGIHGPKGKKRLSDYGTQLAEKQKARKFYGLNEGQFKLIFDKSAKMGGDIGGQFLSLLELRLDNAVYRAGFASSRSLARQLVNHGHFKVNDKKLDIPSYSLKNGDIISVRKSSLNSKYFRDLLEVLKTPRVEARSWLNVDNKNITAKVLHEPKQQDLPLNIKTHMIIEYYSK